MVIMCYLPSAQHVRVSHSSYVFAVYTVFAFAWTEFTDTYF